MKRDEWSFINLPMALALVIIGLLGSWICPWYNGCTLPIENFLGELIFKPRKCERSVIVLVTIL